ncbi:hypothetical protein VE02_08522 [Pseudogymnoascus sp. 03VT05]|nr:hypothetical protein VE02_08522 [Pseudogymnoascus sp. 03VT05]
MKEYLFINASEPHLPEDGPVRRSIRRQAMRDIAAARRRRGLYGKSNLLQVPDFIFADSGPIRPTPIDDSSPQNRLISRSMRDSPQLRPMISTVASEVDHENCPKAARTKPVLLYSKEVPQVPCNESLHVLGSGSTTEMKDRCHDCQADEAFGSCSQQPEITIIYRNQPVSLNINNSLELAILSPLTTLHISRTAIGYFTKPSYLSGTSYYENCSYLRDLPRRYGYSACLDSAIDCVAEKTRESISPVASPPISNSRALYIKALRDLRLSLSLPANCIAAETLCASELLVLWELLSQSETQAYIQHAEGVCRLFKYRKPERFKTEFEKLLFLARAGSIITEALVNNSYCFLQEESWQEVFRSTIIRGVRYSDRSEMTVSLFMSMSYLPDLFRACSCVVLGVGKGSKTSFISLVRRINSHRAGLLEWYGRWESDLHPIMSCVSESTTTDQGQPIDAYHYDQYQEVCGSYMACLVLDNRFLTALGLDEDLLLESQTVGLSGKIMKLHSDVYSTRPQRGLFMTYTVQIAQAALITAEEWRTSCDGTMTETEMERRLIREETFRQWNALMGRILL